MPKRKTDDLTESAGPKKRARDPCDRLSLLSDELLLRVLHNLSIYNLTVCQRVSQRLQTIAGDSQLWKAAYYDRFVKPRANRIRGIRTEETAKERLLYSSKLSRWLDEENLVKGGAKTNWKGQYKLRHKWSNGNCGVSEIPVVLQPPIPPLLARLHHGVVYTVDSFAGLRAWSYRNEQKLLATVSLDDSPHSDTIRCPTSFAIDGSLDLGNEHPLIIGFEDGSFSAYVYLTPIQSFKHIYSHPPSSIGSITSTAVSWPYVLTMTSGQLLSLYTFPSDCGESSSNIAISPPRLLCSLKSHTVWPPLSVSIKIRSSHIIASIAYSLPTYISGWCAGVQEITINAKGEVVQSRLASTVDQGFQPLVSSLSHETHMSRNVPGAGRQICAKPTSLSYSHPYLLMSHSDNTLTLYLVNSNETSLTISAGKRLWGHTSSIFGAHVGGRGKAVSVSTRGNEVRVWELEGTSRTRPSAGVDSSVQITPEKKQQVTAQVEQPRQNNAGTFAGSLVDGETSITRGWVGFDDQNVVVLTERHTSQALTIYDFS